MPFDFMKGRFAQMRPVQTPFRGTGQDVVCRKLRDQAALALRYHNTPTIEEDGKAKEWFRLDEKTGRFMMSVRYGNAILVFNDANEVDAGSTLEEVAEFIPQLIASVRAGDFDAEIKRVSEGFAKRSGGLNKPTTATTSTTRVSIASGAKKSGKPAP